MKKKNKKNDSYSYIVKALKKGAREEFGFEAVKIFKNKKKYNRKIEKEQLFDQLKNV